VSLRKVLQQKPEALVGLWLLKKDYFNIGWSNGNNATDGMSENNGRNVNNAQPIKCCY